MEPEDLTTLAVLVGVYRKAQEAEGSAHDDLFAFIQAKLNGAKRGTVGPMVEEFRAATGLSRARIFDIGAGNWNRRVPGDTSSDD